MRSWLSGLLKNLFGESIARALGGAGLSIATAAILIPAMTTALSTAAAAVGGIGADMLNVALLFGFGEILSIIGTAMITRITLNSTKLGLKKASGT